MSTMTKESISQMNAFLRGELAAVQAYDSARSQLTDLPSELTEIAESHQGRSMELIRHITDQGGEAEITAGWWGAFTDSLQSVASLGGDKAILKLLAQGEIRGLKEYQMDYDVLEEPSASLLVSYLIPQQQITEAKMNLLAQR